jgi:hypothetical protein
MDLFAEDVVQAARRDNNVTLVGRPENKEFRAFLFVKNLNKEGTVSRE